jgi:hypothetical protein
MKYKRSFFFRTLGLFVLLLPVIVPGQVTEKNFIPQKYPGPRSTIPVIQQFSTAQADCQIVRGGFLFYQIGGLIRQIEIFAVYANGNKRRCYNKLNETYWNGHSESDIPDAAMDGSIVSYLITATGLNGLFAERALVFRTPKTTVFEPADHFAIKTVLDPDRKDSPVRFQMSGKFINIERVKIFSGIKPGDLINIQGIGERFNGKAFVSGDHVWWDAAWDTEGLELGNEFEIQAIGNDGCQEKVFHWRVRVSAER